MLIFFDMLTKGDARKLHRWWSTNTTDTFFIRRSPSNKRFYALFRQTKGVPC